MSRQDELTAFQLKVPGQGKRRFDWLGYGETPETARTALHESADHESEKLWKEASFSFICLYELDNWREERAGEDWERGPDLGVVDSIEFLHHRKSDRYLSTDFGITRFFQQAPVNSQSRGQMILHLPCNIMAWHTSKSDHSQNRCAAICSVRRTGTLISHCTVLVENRCILVNAIVISGRSQIIDFRTSKPQISTPASRSEPQVALCFNELTAPALLSPEYQVHHQYLLPVARRKMIRSIPANWAIDSGKLII